MQPGNGAHGSSTDSRRVSGMNRYYDTELVSVGDIWDLVHIGNEGYKVERHRNGLQIAIQHSYVNCVHIGEAHN